MDKGRQIVKVEDPYQDIHTWYDAGQGSVVPTEDRLITMKVKNVPVECPTDQVPVGDGIEAEVLATSRITEDVSLKDLVCARQSAFASDEPMNEKCKNCDTCDDTLCAQSRVSRAASRRDFTTPPTPEQVMEKCKAQKVAYYCSEAYSPTASFDPYENSNYGCSDGISDPQVVHDLRNYHRATLGTVGPASRIALANVVGEDAMLDMIATLPNRAKLVEYVSTRFGEEMANAMRNVIAPLVEYGTQAAVCHGERAAQRVMMTRAVDQK